MEEIIFKYLTRTYTLHIHGDNACISYINTNTIVPSEELIGDIKSVFTLSSNKTAINYVQGWALNKGIITGIGACINLHTYWAFSDNVASLSRVIGQPDLGLTPNVIEVVGRRYHTPHQFLVDVVPEPKKEVKWFLKLYKKIKNLFL